MVEITVFEEAMCCSTGVCGPDPNEELVRFTNTIEQLDEAYSDVTVERANMSGDIEQFLDNETIHDKVQAEGPDVLPIIVADDEIIAEGEYITYETLSDAVDERRQQEVEQ